MVLALVSGGLLLSIAPVVMAADISWQVRNAGGKQAAVELALVNLPAGENPFDPNYADVVATIVDPSGKTFSIPLFWYQGYEIVSSYNQLSNRKVGEPEWRLKFRPNIKGDFKISVSAKINGQQIAIPNTNYTVTENYWSLAISDVYINETRLTSDKDLPVPAIIDSTNESILLTNA
ncbi:MAG: hypothetical protein RLZZ486_726 [Actinomycetota bacterium]